jgi:hypothetical protein
MKQIDTLIQDIYLFGISMPRLVNVSGKARPEQHRITQILSPPTGQWLARLPRLLICWREQQLRVRRSETATMLFLLIDPLGVRARRTYETRYRPDANIRHLLQIYEQALQAGAAAGKTEQASDFSFQSGVESTCGFPLQTRWPQEPHRAEPSLCSSAKAGNCRLYAIPFTGSPRLSGIWPDPNAIHEAVPARTAPADDAEFAGPSIRR